MHMIWGKVVVVCRTLSVSHSWLLSPSAFCSASASANKSRIFCSEPPTNLSKISGPFTTLGSRAFKTCRGREVHHPREEREI